MNRFNVMTLEVQNLDQSTAAMTSALLKNDLKKSFIKTYPRDLPDMLIYAEKYARMEGAFAEDTPVGLVAVGSSKERHSRREEKRRQRSRSPPRDEIMGVKMIDPGVLQEEFGIHHFLDCTIATRP